MYVLGFLFILLHTYSNVNAFIGVNVVVDHTKTTTFKKQQHPLYLSQDHMLPLDRYKSTIDTLQTTIEETYVLSKQIEKISDHLVILESIDPDIIVDNHIKPTINLQGNDYESLLTFRAALERALEVSDTTGRFSVETEHAWNIVKKAILMKDNSTISLVKSTSLLFHPSYRYKYASTLITKLDTSSSISNTIKEQTQQVIDSLKQLQTIIQTEQNRLEERIQQRANYIENLMGGF